MNPDLYQQIERQLQPKPCTVNPVQVARCTPQILASEQGATKWLETFSEIYGREVVYWQAGKALIRALIPTCDALRNEFPQTMEKFSSAFNFYLNFPKPYAETEEEAEEVNQQVRLLNQPTDWEPVEDDDYDSQDSWEIRGPHEGYLQLLWQTSTDALRALTPTAASIQVGWYNPYDYSFLHLLWNLDGEDHPAFQHFLGLLEQALPLRFMPNLSIPPIRPNPQNVDHPVYASTSTAGHNDPQRMGSIVWYSLKSWQADQATREAILLCIEKIIRVGKLSLTDKKEINTIKTWATHPESSKKPPRKKRWTKSIENAVVGLSYSKNDIIQGWYYFLHGFKHRHKLKRMPWTRMKDPDTLKRAYTNTTQCRWHLMATQIWGCFRVAASTMTESPAVKECLLCIHGDHFRKANATRNKAAALITEVANEWWERCKDFI